MSKSTVAETHLADLKLLHRGKVRDLYDLEDRLLIISTDRISAFDYVLQCQRHPIQGTSLNGAFRILV